MLTIAIPTYNDYQTLSVQLNRILIQIEGLPIKVKIFDNNPLSSFDLSQIRSDQLIYIKQPKNIGPDWNIYTCFVNCETKYLWILSTNDLVKTNCLTKIIEVLKNNPETAFFHLGQTKKFKGYSLEDLLLNISYQDAFTISRCIYNMYVFRESLISYPRFIQTMQAQYLMVIELFSRSQTMSFIKLTYEPIENYRISGWSKRKFILATFLAANILKKELKNHKKLLVNTIDQIQEMLIWQILISRSFQNLGRFKFIFLTMKILFMNPDFRNNFTLIRKYSKSLVWEFFKKGFSKEKWRDNYQNQQNPFKIEYD
jgi:hypothetical protein